MITRNNISSFTPFQTILGLIRNIFSFRKDKDKVKFGTGFTLVELLIVIAILAILAAAVVIVINPGEMMAQARDAERISSIESLKKSIDLFVLDNPGSSLGTSQVISISIPDTSATCANITGLPSLPAGWSYRCVTAANLRNLDSTGWLPINLTSIKGGSPLPSLPIDPDNTAITRYYQYIPGSTSGSYELTSLLESEKQSKIAAKDGGTDPGRIETGTDISLWRTASGLVGYWPFEGVGAILNNQTAGFQDLSGNLNNLTALKPNTSGMNFVPGKLGNAVSFDGIDDYLTLGRHLTNGYPKLSYFGWFKTSSAASQGVIDEWTNSASFIFQVSGKVNLYLSTGGTNPGWQNNVSGLLNDGIWHHFGVVYDGSNEILYIDGAQVFSTAGTGIIGNISSTYFKIGAWAGAGEAVTGFMNGQIDEISVYNRSFSSSEVKAIYNSEK